MNIQEKTKTRKKKNLSFPDKILLQNILLQKKKKKKQMAKTETLSK